MEKKIGELFQVYDNIPLKIAQKGYRYVACCACGLTHKYRITGPKQGVYLVYIARDEEVTSIIRARKQFPLAAGLSGQPVVRPSPRIGAPRPRGSARSRTKSGPK